MNTPEFFWILPDISQLKGIDIGCGEGYNTRIASKKGAQMVGINISTIFIEKALEKFPHLVDCNIVANFLIIRCRKQ